MLYDKVGDRVETEYDIEESDNGDNVVLGQNIDKKMKYRYRSTKAMDN